MSQANSMPARMFDLEGIFLGFLGNDPRKPKSIILDVEHEQMAIKLPKELRVYARSSLKVGDRLRCVGKSQVDLEAGIIKLRAYQVFFLPSDNTSSTATSTVHHADQGVVRQPSDGGVPAGIRPGSQRSQLLVCRKSGCQKRGGRRMVEALERILQTYQLHDQVEIRYTGCQKRCSKAPNLTVMPGKHCYENVSAKDLTALIEEHFCPPNSPPAP